MVRRLLIAIAGCGLLAGLAGCGNSRAAPFALAAPVKPFALHVARYPREGVSFRVPVNWSIDPGQDDLLVRLTSGQATIAVWRYPRSEQLPDTPARLETARRGLVAAARKRDPTLKIARSPVLRVATDPAIEIDGTESVGGRRRQVRSTHVYGDGGEVVVDAYAPARWFDRVNRTVLDPLLASLRLGPPR